MPPSGTDTFKGGGKVDKGGGRDAFLRKGGGRFAVLGKGGGRNYSGFLEREMFLH
jgi:hypothetical protein